LLSQAVEISLEEEGAISSMREKSTAGVNTVRCTICSRLGHLASKCMRRGFPLPDARAVSVVICFKCRRAGHLARDCRQEPDSDFGGPTGHAVSRQGTMLDTRRQRGLLEAACGAQRSWVCEGNSSQGPTSSQSHSQTKRQ
jgi:hypothetical protein